MLDDPLDLNNLISLKLGNHIYQKSLQYERTSLSFMRNQNRQWAIMQRYFF